MVCQWFICFLIYSFMGWIYETILCTIKDHGWSNRGFLFGPVIPIYGFGASLASFLFILFPIPWLQNGGHGAIFVTCAAGSFVLEYSTSYVLEKIFHAVWWDYSRMPLNIHGRVCLPFTLLFGVAGVIVVSWVIPPIISIPLFQYKALTEFISLFLAIILGIDIALTITELNEFNRKFVAMNEQINEKMAERVEQLGENIAEVREKMTKEHIEAYFKHASYAQKAAISHVVELRPGRRSKEHESLMTRGFAHVKASMSHRFGRKKTEIEE